MSGKGVLKGCLIASVVAIVLIALIAVIAIKATSGIVDTADEFFDAVKSKNMSAAHGCLSEEFRAETNVEELEIFLKHTALVNVVDARWGERSIENKEGKLSGTVETETGGSIPISMTFVKENGKWKIYGIQKPQAGIVTPGEAPSVPDEATQKALVKRAIHDFALAVNAESFVAFHAGLARPFREQFSAEQLLETFKGFCEQDVDLTVVDDMDPILDEAATIDEDGVLAIKGHYESAPSKTYFDIKFFGTPWKVLGINVRVK
jgi:hypothetical protein